MRIASEKRLRYVDAFIMHPRRRDVKKNLGYPRARKQRAEVISLLAATVQKSQIELQYKAPIVHSVSDWWSQHSDYPLVPFVLALPCRAIERI